MQVATGADANIIVVVVVAAAVVKQKRVGQSHRKSFRSFAFTLLIGDRYAIVYSSAMQRYLLYVYTYLFEILRLGQRALFAFSLFILYIFSAYYVCVCVRAHWIAVELHCVYIYCVTSKPLHVFSLSLCFILSCLSFSQFRFDNTYTNRLFFLLVFARSLIQHICTNYAILLVGWMDGSVSFLSSPFFHIIFHLTRFYFLDFVPNMYKVRCTYIISVSTEYAVICKMLSMTAKETIHVTAHEPGMKNT